MFVCSFVCLDTQPSVLCGKNLQARLTFQFDSFIPAMPIGTETYRLDLWTNISIWFFHTCHANRHKNLQARLHLHHLHLGFVHPLQDVALHQCLPLSSVCCFPNPGGSLLLCYVILPSSAWSSSRPLPLWRIISVWFFHTCHAYRHH